MTDTDEVLARLDELRDLFTRRLLTDRTTRDLLAELNDRTRQAEAGLFRQYLYPLVSSLARVIDRLDRYDGADPAFAASIRDELLDTLADQGVTQVPTGGGFDPARHEAVGVVEEPSFPDRAVAVVRRRGLAHGDWVFRPAQVLLNRTTEEEEPHQGPGQT